MSTLSDDPETIAGQGTVGVEILRQCSIDFVNKDSNLDAGKDFDAEDFHTYKVDASDSVDPVTGAVSLNAAKTGSGAKLKHSSAVSSADRAVTPRNSTSQCSPGQRTKNCIRCESLL